MGKMQTAEVVARTIVDCIRNPKVEIYPYSISRVVAWANAVAPSLLDKIMAPYFRERIRAKINP